MFDIADFRGSFPEFSDTIKFPDSQITYWSNVAQCATSKTVFGCMYTNILYLYVAHTLAIAYKNKLSPIPGQGAGLTSSKAVGSASVSYDNQAIIEPGGGYWNETSYGREYLRLLRIFAAGCRQV